MINIAILDYPNSLPSARFGLLEMFGMANTVLTSQTQNKQFYAEIINVQQLPSATSQFDAILLPPALGESFYLAPSKPLLNWLQQQQQRVTIIGSACAGTFILAAAGLLHEKRATTHWELEYQFRRLYPNVELNIEKILTNDSGIITAGGMMSWVDLGLDVIAKLTDSKVMRQLGKILVVDTGAREQRYYQQFSPNFTHNDPNILVLQQHLKHNFQLANTINDMALLCHLTPRTLQRRFIAATGFKPHYYLQRVRIQKACEMLENSLLPFESIAIDIGFSDSSACRKLFIKVMGLSPSEFKKRFV